MMRRGLRGWMSRASNHKRLAPFLSGISEWTWRRVSRDQDMIRIRRSDEGSSSCFSGFQSVTGREQRETLPATADAYLRFLMCAEYATVD